jgi:electron transfer flavoprotein alpha subunit
MSVVLTLIELDGDAVAKASRETLTLARSLADAHGWALDAAVVGLPAETAQADLRDQGVRTVHALVHDQLDADAAPAAIAEAVAQLQDQVGAGAVVGSGEDHSAEVLAHVAARMDRPLAANCTTVAPSEGGGWELTRVRWGGVLLEDAHLDADVALLTAAPHQTAAQNAASAGAAEVAPFEPRLDDDALHVTRVAERASRGGGISLATARVVVAGGRGVGSAEGFGILEELAQLLGGAVGCSRVATNNGWRSHNDQVGQTGTRVAPDLYIACGISGATQHWVGCMSSKRILSINTDPEAPMVTRADYAVLGDVHDVLPAVVEEVKARTGVG